MTIPTERLREMNEAPPSLRYVTQDEGLAMATELLAARDALAALTKERDALNSEKANGCWVAPAFELNAMNSEISRLHAVMQTTITAWDACQAMRHRSFTMMTPSERQEQVNTERALFKAIDRTRAALAATEGGQGGGR